MMTTFSFVSGIHGFSGASVHHSTSVCARCFPPSRRRFQLQGKQPITCVGYGAAAAAPEPNFDATSSTPPPPPSSSNWQQIGACDVLIPTNDPVATVVFIGGLGAGINPPAFYGNLLRRISETGRLAIVCARLSPIPSTDHSFLSNSVSQSLISTVSSLPSAIRSLPLIGMGHSLGSKLLLLSCVNSTTRKDLPLQACIFLSFNNSKLRQALPIDSASDAINSFAASINNLNIPGSMGTAARSTIDSVLRSVQDTLSTQQDFIPSPEATLAMTGARYPVRHNLIVSFQDDDIDDGPDLTNILKSRFGQSGIVMERSLPGTHLTPVAPDFSNSDFTSMGNEGINDAVRRAGLGVTKEVDGAVAVIIAFTRLHLQMRESS